MIDGAQAVECLYVQRDLFYVGVRWSYPKNFLVAEQSSGTKMSDNEIWSELGVRDGIYAYS